MAATFSRSHVVIIANVEAGLLLLLLMLLAVVVVEDVVGGNGVVGGTFVDDGDDEEEVMDTGIALESSFIRLFGGCLLPTPTPP